ncbi:uncharacterized protein I206_105300 [Kwoniella pini CBS 10737]|uniref:C2H2-type domain-containing protein n=1 Tax=Kwoniella pini CBS 10737 TaxID=1296096 RepID=A0A1B9I4L5_9TREE|nr:uncharacterized protein I206_03790 [Kwoniella pini CBS 10737]OCF50468.1 hypothetical protein I206_03790 [Kwoniella pini CBS 10737]
MAVPTPPTTASTSSITFEQWRSPPPKETPLAEPASLPGGGLLSPKSIPSESPSIAQIQMSKNDLLHPSFLPPCEHGQDDGDMHAHAFDLLSLSGNAQTSSRPPMPASKSTTNAVPSSVPAHTTSFLSASRPPVVNGNGNTNGLEKKENGNGSAPKARRMSSSTTGVLGRGKLGLTGTTEGGLGLGGMGKDIRSGSYNDSRPIPNRRPTISGSPAPQLFDFAKTDRRPSAPSVTSRTASAVPASLPARSHIPHTMNNEEDDIELDMEFDGDEEDDGEIKGGSDRSGSADIEMDEDDDGEISKLAIGTGSGGIKGRRKGMVFKCETCKKEYRHPSCLVKHRWEHSPHWKEPTALSMSKHQQVQMLEAAAILAHLDPRQLPGRSLPNDKSLWPAILEGKAAGRPRSSSRAMRDPSILRSPPSSVIAPLTPSSLRDPMSLGTLAEQPNGKERKSSPGSDSTTSSMGAGEPYIPAHQNGLSIRNSNGYINGNVNGHGISSPRISKPMGINQDRRSSNGNINGTPHSIGSLPDMSGLNFHSGTPTSLGMSPIPKRTTRLMGGGMFGNVHTAVPSSSVRSGAADLPEEEEEDDVENDWSNVRGKSSSAEPMKRNGSPGEGEGEGWNGMAMEMEL